jgi:hypothetical protein
MKPMLISRHIPYQNSKREYVNNKSSIWARWTVMNFIQVWLVYIEKNSTFMELRVLTKAVFLCGPETLQVDYVV